MGDNNWVVENLQNALSTWNAKLQEIFQLLLTDPEAFRGGGVWAGILEIHDALKATGLALLVLFFAAGVVRTTTSHEELRRPERAFRLFLRFVLAKALVTYGMDVLLALLRIGQGIVGEVVSPPTLDGALTDATGIWAELPAEVEAAIQQAGFWESVPLWIVTILGSLVITVLSFILLMTVYGRFFSIYIHAAVAPIPLAAFAGEGTSQIGVQFLKSFAGVCLQGAVIALACAIFTTFAAAPPALGGTGAVQLVWNYVAELAFNLLVLVGAVKLSERLCKEMLGL